MSDLKITPENFKIGRFCIAVNVHKENDLQSYIDTFEKIYLQDLLGCELYDLFIADLDASGMPQTPIYINIYQAFCIDYRGCGNKVRSEGMVQLLKEFIYFEYVRNQKVANSNGGNVVNINEASRETVSFETDIYDAYNNGIKNYKAIQFYICENSTDYPTYNGERKDITGIV